MTEIKTAVKVGTRNDDIYELGAWMGRKQALASMAGRCSAADAECLRQIRDQKRYRALNMSWEQFCTQRIGATHKTVDKIIRRLEEFGPAYFMLVQATGISDNDYRRIASSVKELNLLHAGEEIPIVAENAPKLAAAVEALGRELPDKDALRRGLPGGIVEDSVDARSGGPVREAGLPAEGPARVRAVVRELQAAKREMHSALRRYGALAGQNLASATRQRIGTELRAVALELKQLSTRIGHE